MAARYGGDEFAVLLAGADEGTAVAIAERIRARVESTVIPLGPGLTDRITISVGRAMDPANGTERVSLMRSADLALYRAKEAGRNRVVATDDPVPVIAVPSMAGRRRESLLSTQR
jgi:diguanylate cyclase (GGDEF)-like protein